MAEYVQVYHDVEERNRSTWHGYEDVRGLVRGVLQDDAPVLVFSDGKSERRYVLEATARASAFKEAIEIAKSREVLMAGCGYGSASGSMVQRAAVALLEAAANRGREA